MGMFTKIIWIGIEVYNEMVPEELTYFVYSLMIMKKPKRSIHNTFAFLLNWLWLQVSDNTQGQFFQGQKA